MDTTPDDSEEYPKIMCRFFEIKTKNYIPDGGRVVLSGFCEGRIETTL